MRILAVLFFAVTLVAQVPSATQMGYTYTLATDQSNVTVGVKDASGALIRTISRGQSGSAGTYSGVWDGNTDAGTAATGGPFTIAVLYGNPTYTFDGAISNTGNSLTGWGAWARSQLYMSISKLTFIGNTGWITEGGSEAANGLSYFSDTNPNSPMVVSPSYVGTLIGFSEIDNDGQYLYIGSAADWNGAASFVTKFDGFTGRPVLFTQGQITVGAAPPSATVTFAYPGTTMSAIDINNTAYDHIPTGIAVQTGGQLLAVAHGNWRPLGGTGHQDAAVLTNNVIKFFDKTTGATTGSNVTIANPTSMGFNSAGNLWVLANGAVNLITGPSGANTITQPLSGLVFPVSLAVNKTNNHIYVLDGGTSQQLKEFDASYALVRTYGQLHGYTDCNPTVSPDRLMLDYTAVWGITQLDTPVTAYVRVEDDGDVWLFDSLNGGYSAGKPTGFNGGNTGRLQHLTPNGAGYTMVHQVIYTALQYYMTVSHTQPNRVFAQMLEFSFDYTKPNPPGDPQAPGGTGAWKLVRDWAVGAGGACGSSGTFQALNHYTYFQSVEQLSNGRTYAVIVNNPNILTMWELPANGTTAMRSVPNPLGANTSYMMGRDGSFNYSVNTGTGTITTTQYKRSLTGFDGSNNPTYGAATPITSVTYDSTKQPTASATSGASGLYQNNNEPTTGGVYPVVQWLQWNNNATTNLPHLGGMLIGRNSYLFTVAPEVCTPFPSSGAFVGTYPCAGAPGAQLSNPGPGIYTEGRHILLPFTTNGSTVQPSFWHYWEDGMFIGQFGPLFSTNYVPTSPNTIPHPSYLGALNPYNTAVGFQGVPIFEAAGMVENAASTRVISMNGDLYMFLDAEGYTTPITIWKLSNLASIHELAGTGTLGQSVALTTQVF